MRTLTTTTVKKRIAELNQRSKEFVMERNKILKTLQDRCLHEETAYYIHGGQEYYPYEEHGTTYCSVCDKKLNET